ncbi:Protein ACTIVITY OF BC1 COMPLEX KINASE 3, chloroplastic [Linum grandiflorum]
MHLNRQKPTPPYSESTLPASPPHRPATRKPAAFTSDILRLFHTLDLPLQPDLYVSLVNECTIQRDSASALRLHTLFTNSRSPSAVHVLLLDRLLLMHVSCGHVQIARQLFNEMPPLDRHAISWAILVTAYSHDAQYDETILLFLQMLQDDDTSCCSFPGLLWFLFSRLCDTDTPSIWASKIEMNYKEGRFAEVIEEFKRMGSAGICCTDGVLCTVLRACGKMEDGGRTARQVDAFAMKLQGGLNGKNGLYVEAFKLLYKMKAVAVEVTESLVNRVRIACGTALQNFFDDALNYTVSELNFKTLVDGLGAVFYQYPFNVPAYYALILRSLTVLGGLALNADPNFKVLAASYPYFGKRLLTDPNPYLRDALIELLFKDGRFRWKRLENILVQGSKDRDFSARDALQPVLKLLLGEDGDLYRPLQILIRPFCSLYYSLGGRHVCWWLKAGDLTSKGFLERHLRGFRHAALLEIQRLHQDN